MREPKQNKTYRLTSLSIHIGNSDFGHYIAAGKREGKVI